MSKKLFLAAASVAAMAFAGAATAGEITGHFGAVAGANNVFAPAAGNVAAKSYKVASERTVGTAAAKIAGVINATNTLTTAIDVPAASNRDFLVSFEVTGAKVLSAGLALTDTSTGAGTVGASLVSNNNGVVTYLVTVTGAKNITAFTLSAGVEQEAQAAVNVSGSVVAIIGGTNITVDTAAAVKAAEYKPMLGSIKTTANELTANLPDYFKVNGLATGDLAANFKFVNAGTFYRDLNATAVAASDVLDGGVITVRGPLISENVTVDLIGTLDADNTEVNTAVFDLTAGEAATLAAGAEVLSITQTAVAADREAFRAGTYRVTWAPKAKTGFSVPAASTVDAGSIVLDGTNFVAPWVSGSGAATSVIRIANSNSAASGAVTVRLLNAVKVVNGVSTPVASTAVLSAGTVPAGADLQITSAQLVAAFGDFTRADVQVTINSQDDGFTAKLRNTRDGQTFEQSLSNSDFN